LAFKRAGEIREVPEDEIEYVQGGRMPSYTDAHARAGIDAKLPQLETWPNHFPGYEITIRFPEYTSVCPKTGLPDYGAITIQYTPDRKCLELKALKMYLLAYRNLGIFYENAVNRMLRDIVAALHPVQCRVTGEFTPRGGLTTTVEARWPRTSAEVRRTSRNKRKRPQGR
jgi:7-cyano-7-deazaguanine reductase